MTPKKRKKTTWALAKWSRKWKAMILFQLSKLLEWIFFPSGLMKGVLHPETLGFSVQNPRRLLSPILAPSAPRAHQPGYLATGLLNRLGTARSTWTVTSLQWQADKQIDQSASLHGFLQTHSAAWVQLRNRWKVGILMVAEWGRGTARESGARKLRVPAEGVNLSWIRKEGEPKDDGNTRVGDCGAWSPRVIIWGQ